MSSTTFGKLSKDLLQKHLQEDVKDSDQIFVTTFDRIPANAMVDLRKRLREGGTRYRVVKNSLAKRVLSEEKYAGLVENIDGQCGLGISTGEVTAVSKILVNFSKENETFKFNNLLFDGKLYDTGQIKELAQLPTREELLAMVCGGLNSPIVGFVGVLSALLRNFVNVLDQIRSKKE